MEAPAKTSLLQPHLSLVSCQVLRARSQKALLTPPPWLPALSPKGLWCHFLHILPLQSSKGLASLSLSHTHACHSTQENKKKMEVRSQVSGLIFFSQEAEGLSLQGKAGTGSSQNCIRVSKCNCKEESTQSDTKPHISLNIFNRKQDKAH